MIATSPRLKKKTPLPANGCEFESIALLLQGGGALGAYQAGVYQALEEADLLPDWVGGISIGAVNGAIIAGNMPGKRIEKLRGFWGSLTDSFSRDQFGALGPFMQQSGDAFRTFWNQMSAEVSMVNGVPGFFTPRVPPPWLLPPGSIAATSFYDTGAFKKTLERFIDFDVLNSGAVRYTTSAVNVRSGNYTLFDTRVQEIKVEHIMASGALPPALPAIEIDGQYFWDGGLISNTPLQWVMDEAMQDTLVFQVDLWSAKGGFPRDMFEVMTREKEIRYSSRTRAMTTSFKHAQKMRHAFAALYDKLPANLKRTEEARMLLSDSDINVYNIVHLIYRARHYEGYSKDFEFSRLSMEEHWKAGYHDTVRSLRHKEVLKLPECPEGIETYDMLKA
jgi:NTE family protein